MNARTGIRRALTTGKSERRPYFLIQLATDVNTLQGRFPGRNRFVKRPPSKKIMTLREAVAWRRRLADSGRELVVTNGCFDLLHRGHAEYLARACRHGDALLVAVNSDASVRTVKGPGRPVVNEKDRAYLLASLEAVDSVVVFNERQAINVFRAIVPDVYIKGGDYTEKTIDQDEYVVLKKLGCRFEFVPFIQGRSTTETIERMKESQSEPGDR